MTKHRWVDSSDGSMGFMLALTDDELTPESEAALQEFVDYLAAHKDLVLSRMQPAAKLSEDEAAEPGERQMARILELRRRAGLDA